MNYNLVFEVRAFNFVIKIEAQMKSNLQSLFNPKSIVLIGASSKPGSIGYEILKSIINFSYQGKIFVINPNAEEILGIKCHSALSQISERIELAIILTPKKFVIQNLIECAQSQIKNVIVITAGFKEVGAEGKELENELIRIAKENDIRLVGPNCMGIINTEPTIKLNATFVAEMPKYSKVGFLSQSGSLAAAVLNTLSETGFSFNQFISVGNKADINENDVLEYWIEDENINVITMYLESFEEGREFFEIAKQVSHQKPNLVLKAARYEYGMKAASSHTGALASKDIIIDTMLKQAGIIRVDTIEEMFESADAFQKFSLPGGNKVAIITNAGGMAILCVDECEKLGFALSQLEQSTKEKIKPLLVPEASLNNPIDMLPSADGDVFKR
ncbi:MAG: CoA-binding protein, partial [Ignavibacteria bacterium]|nr:CoA-binding protein [Ignavibacteria bacterium]